MSASVGRHLKDLVSLGFFGPGRPLLSRLSRKQLDQLAAAVAGVGNRMDPGRSTLAREELGRCFPAGGLPRGEEEILRDAWHLAAFNELEVLRYPAMNPDNVEAVCTVDGLEHLREAEAAGRGAILAIGHLGANQMIMPALGHRGFAMNQLSAPPTVWAEIHREGRTTPAYRRLLAHRWRLEQALPVRHINVFRFLRPALECLTAGEVLGLAFDGGGGKRWAQVDFLGRRANVSVQSVQLARKTGAALLPTRVGRLPGEERHRVEIHAPMELVDEQATLQAIADQFTDWVRARPEQYLPFLVVRRQMASMDVQPFFADYPELPEAGDAEVAAARLRAAAQRAGVAGTP